MITIKIVQGVPSISKWRKDVNISYFESPYDARFHSCEILHVKIDDESMKKSWMDFPLLSI